MKAEGESRVVPSYGIGKEVTAAALTVMTAAQAPVELTEFNWSADRYLNDGTTVPPDVFAFLARDFDAILVDAQGDPRVPTIFAPRNVSSGERGVALVCAFLQSVAVSADVEEEY